jgi:hypothetical protein
MTLTETLWIITYWGCAIAYGLTWLYALAGWIMVLNKCLRALAHALRHCPPSQEICHDA